jgi:sugar transferase (PEP-CTERM system associated)
LTYLDRRFALIALLELLLVATVFSAAFLVVASAQHPGLPQGMPWAVAAHLTFALSLLLPASVCGLHRPRHGEAVLPFVGKFLLSMALGALLCHVLFALFPPITPFAASIPDAVVMGAVGLVAVRMALSGAQSGALSHRVLVLGTGPEAAAVDATLSRLAHRGVQVVGFYQTDAAHPVSVPRERILASTPLQETIRSLRIREIVVAMREQRGGRMPLDDLLSCRLQGVPVTDLPALFERVAGAVHLESLKASWLIYGRGFHQGLGRRAVKRAFDLLAAATLLLLAAPIMLIAAAAIYAESGRPVVFRQERIGLGGRSFMLFSSAACARRRARRRAALGRLRRPRITRVGRFMRRVRIDELPQIFNILRGEMSLVGPRPERPFFVAQLSRHVPFYAVRHAVKPGLTGWAQVRYSYGASVEDAMRKLEYDLYYVKNHSLLLDLVTLLLTVRVVLLGEGAR